MSRLAAERGPMTPERARALIHELDHLHPTDADTLTPFQRATYRRAIDTADHLAARHRAALLLTIGKIR